MIDHCLSLASVKGEGLHVAFLYFPEVVTCLIFGFL